MNVDDIRREHGEFLLEMANKSVGTVVYHIFAEAYDEWCNEEIDRIARERTVQAQL